MPAIPLSPIIANPEKYYSLMRAVAKFCAERGLKPVKKSRPAKSARKQIPVRL